MGFIVIGFIRTVFVHLGQVATLFGFRVPGLFVEVLSCNHPMMAMIDRAARAAETDSLPPVLVLPSGSTCCGSDAPCDVSMPRGLSNCIAVHRLQALISRLPVCQCSHQACVFGIQTAAFGIQTAAFRILFRHA